MSNSGRPHGLQHARLPCPSLSPRVCTHSCPLHQWCHPTISSSDALFSFCSQSSPASGTFPMSQLFPADDQNTGVSTSSSVLSMSMQHWFPLRATDFDYLAIQGTHKSSPAPLLESINSSSLHLLYNPVLHRFPARKQTSSDLMVAVTIRSDLRVQEEEICYEFHRFHIYLPWSNGAGCHDLSFCNIWF